MTTLNVIQFPEHFAAIDIPNALRTLADEIESGQMGGAAHALLWVVDAGDGDIEMGVMGKVSDAGFAAYFLAGAAQQKIMKGIG